MKTSKKVKRIVIIVIAVILIAGIICGAVFGTKEANKNNYYNLDKKTARFVENEDAFNDSLYAVLNGNTDELEILSVENGIVEYSTNDVLKKYKVKSVSGKNSVIDYSLSTLFYESGYLYSENPENIFPVHIDDADLLAEKLVQQDGGEFIAGSYNEQKSDSENWLVIKQINDNWYYYEYHTK